MTDLIPDRLQELRRIAVEITLGTYEWRIIETGLALLDCIEALEQELDAARAEAERWKQRYEFLRSEMERLVQELRQRAHLFAKDWLETDDLYYEGASDAYRFAEKMVRRLLSEAGGVSQ